MDKALFTNLIQWSIKEFSDLPWRVKSQAEKNLEQKLYYILVSEIMLQQTTVSTVSKKYDSFLERFPNLMSLAKADLEDVLLHWQGLGYYRRAKNLHLASQYIYVEKQGIFPKSLNELKSIPGIGDYTSRALLAFGLNQNYLALDANLERVFARLWGIEIEKGVKLQKQIYQRESDFFEHFDLNARDLNAALMDLGRTRCQVRSVQCEICPLALNCEAFKKSMALELPRKKDSSKKTLETKTQELTLVRLIVQNPVGDLLVQKKREGQWLEGQFELPTFTLGQKHVQYPLLSSEIMNQLFTKIRKKKTFKQVITHHKIVNQIYRVPYKIFQEQLEEHFKEFPFIFINQENLKHVSHQNKKMLSLWDKNGL